MPNFEDFELDLKKVKTNSSKGIEGASWSAVTKITKMSYDVNCSMHDCATANVCSGGDMSAACYAADEIICRC